MYWYARIYMYVLSIDFTNVNKYRKRNQKNASSGTGTQFYKLDFLQTLKYAAPRSINYSWFEAKIFDLRNNLMSCVKLVSIIDLLNKKCISWQLNWGTWYCTWYGNGVQGCCRLRRDQLHALIFSDDSFIFRKLTVLENLAKQQLQYRTP